MNVLSSKSILKHWKRFHEQPLLYSLDSKVFPPKLGRRFVITETQSLLLVVKIKQRLKNLSLAFPTLYTFTRLAEDITGRSFSLSTMSRFCSRHKLKYDSPSCKKKGTRYHDSDIVISERVEFLIQKIWFLAWEQEGIVEFFVHDESHIAEKPSGYQYWQYVPDSGKGAIDPGNKIGGRRFAFSALYSRNYGLECGLTVNQLNDLQERICVFKNFLDDFEDISVKEYLRLAKKSGLTPNSSMSLDSKNNTIIPDDGNCSFFQFICATEKQGLHGARQMDSLKFIWSMSNMIEQAVKAAGPNKTVIFQVDNATYHRQPLDRSLRDIKGEYPSKIRETGEMRTSMIDMLRTWDIKPTGAPDSFFNPMASCPRKKKSEAEAEKVAREKCLMQKAQHKAKIKELFRLAPQYRYQRTMIEEIAENIGHENDTTVKVIFGPRGHSELAEIEFSWSFIKRTIIRLNPLCASETEKLLELARRLDYSNRGSWRDLVLINMYAYLHHGYFDHNLGKKLLLNKEMIKQYFSALYLEIPIKFDFTDEGFSKFTSWFTPQIKPQLTYKEILDLEL